MAVHTGGVMKLEFLVTMSPSTPRVTQSQEEVASIMIAALEKKIAEIKSQVPNTSAAVQ